MDKPSTRWVGSPNFTPQKGITPRFYVVHWMVGNLATTDRLFQDPNYGVATNYGIENGTIHQYVKDGDYAYGTGDTYANRYGVSVEHSGGWLLPDGTRFTPTPYTHETSARLLAWLSYTYRWGTLKKGVNVFEHRDFVPTQCPGTTDTAWIIRRANQLLAATPELEDPMSRLIRHPNGAIALAGNEGSFIPLRTMDEVQSLIATGAVPNGWIDLPDGLIWDMRERIAARKNSGHKPASV